MLPSTAPQVVTASPTTQRSYPMPPLSRDATTLDVVAMMLDQLLEAVALVADQGAVSQECIIAVLEHGQALYRWHLDRAPDSAARAAHSAMWRLVEMAKGRAWLESVALEVLDRHVASTLIWMAFRVSGYITERDSGIDAPVWVRMSHAGILARFGVSPQPLTRGTP